MENLSLKKMSPEMLDRLGLTEYVRIVRPENPLKGVTAYFEHITQKVAFGDDPIPLTTMAGAFHLRFKDIERPERKDGVPTGKIIKGLPFKEAMSRVRSLFSRKSFLKYWSVKVDKVWGLLWLVRLDTPVLQEEDFIAAAAEFIAAVGPEAFAEPVVTPTARAITEQQLTTLHQDLEDMEAEAVRLMETDAPAEQQTAQQHQITTKKAAIAVLLQNAPGYVNGGIADIEENATA